MFWTPGTVSAVDRSSFAQARDVGSAVVHERVVNGRTLDFEPNSGDVQTFRDTLTGSTWDIFGRAVAGPLRGAELPAVVHGTHFWFAWAAFFPETALVVD